MKVFICTPVRRFDHTEPHRDLLRWAWGTEEKHAVRWAMDTTYGIDAARSRLIKEARDWGAELLIMVDSDVIPVVSWRDAFSVFSQAFSRGYAAVLSPTVSSTNEIIAWAAPGKPAFRSPTDIPPGLSEVSWGGLGFLGIDGDALSRLKVLKEQGSLQGARFPLYCLYTPGEDGEDRSLCENLRESTGKKIGVDTRLVTDHLKLSGRRSWQGAGAVAV